MHWEGEDFGCLQQDLLLGQVANDPEGAFQGLPCPRSHLLSPRHRLSPQQQSHWQGPYIGWRTLLPLHAPLPLPSPWHRCSEWGILWSQVQPFLTGSMFCMKTPYGWLEINTLFTGIYPSPKEEKRICPFVRFMYVLFSGTVHKVLCPSSFLNDCHGDFQHSLYPTWHAWLLLDTAAPEQRRNQMGALPNESGNINMGENQTFSSLKYVYSLSFSRQKHF